MPVLTALPVSAASCVTGVLPPLAGAGRWVIYEDTIIGEGCQVSHGDDLQIIGGKRLQISAGILTLSGWLNVSQGATLEMTAFGAIHVPPGTPNVRLRIATGAIITLHDALLDLEGVDAAGPSNQGSLEMINTTMTARSAINASTNSVLIQGSTVNVTVPNAPANADGGNGSLHIGGRIFADVSSSTFYLRAGNGGVGTAGGNGGRGGTATAFMDPRSVNYVTVTVIGGQGGTGGQGANGATGGQGGQGGGASLSQSADTISNSQIRVVAGSGGSGASGADWLNGSGGNGGAPKRGGDAYGRVAGYSGLTLTQTTVTVIGGNGGTGGSGGDYRGTGALPKGGDAANGAQGGAATALVEAPGAVVLNYATVTATAGPGGLGGNYGEGVQGAQVQDGSAGAGGDGGNANARTNSNSNSLRVSNSSVLARAGAGGQGGDGSLQGGDGGDGGDAFAGAFGRASVTIFDTCYNGTGGPGGPAKPGQLASGYGGAGGDGTTRINSTGLIVMANSCAGAMRGRGGTATGPGSTGRVGPNGILEDLFVNGSKIDFSHSKFGNALDDYNGLDTGRLYNVTFTAPLGGSPVIPLGPHKVEMYWDLTVHVTDGRDPIPGVRVLVTRCPSWVGGASFDQATTGADGTSRFNLLSWVYSSSSSGTQFVGCYMIESQYEGRQQEPRQDFLDGNHFVEFAYYSNNEAPRITILQPSQAVYRVDADHPDVPVLLRVDDPDDAQTGVPTVFKVWACISTEPQCVDRTDISHTRTVDPNTREVRYNWTFNVSNVNEFPSGQYFICAKASDSFLESPWTCKGFAINQVLQALPRPELSGGSKIRDEATKMITFDGRVNNLEALANYTVPITILVYRWDFDGDGTWDYYSTTNGRTTHIYPNVDQTTVYRANFSVIDSLGRESAPVTREITIDPHVVIPAGVIEIYGYVILYALIGAVGLTGSAFLLQRRRQTREAEEAAQREAEILANIHECPRCGDLLPEKFAVCIRCATEDGIASVRKTVGELKQVGVIVLEEEDLIDKANIAFEGRDFDTAGQFLEKVKTRVEVNKKRHKGTTALIRRERLYIRMLEEQGKDLAHLEPEVYHAELALGRSDFDGADRMVEDIRKKIQGVVYEDKRREILERFTKLERQVKSKDQTDDEVRLKATEALRLLERAKVALGKRSFVEAVQYYTDAFVLTEGAPPDPIIKEPSDEEFDLFETRLKMQEEGVYMGPTAQATSASPGEKVWRPGEKEFKVQDSTQAFRPGDHATTMTEGQAHGRDTEVPPAKPTPAPSVAGPVAPAAPSYVMEPLPPKEAKIAPPAVKPAPPTPAPAVAGPVAPSTPAPAAPAAPTMKCAVCGTALKSGWKRCPKCATPVPGETEAPAAPAATPPPASPAAAPAPAATVAANCPNCKKPVKANWKKCPYCAHALQ